MKFILSLLLLFVAAPIYAGSTGLFWDKNRSGEGLLVLRDDRLIVTYLFTLGANACDDDDKPSVGPVVEEFYDCSVQGQRWLFTSDKYNEVDEEAVGFIFMARGTNYPEGIPSPTDPFSVDIAEAKAVGVYVLRPAGDGYQMLIVPYGDALDDDDPLYSRVYQFTSALFEPLGIEPR